MSQNPDEYFPRDMQIGRSNEEQFTNDELLRGLLESVTDSDNRELNNVTPSTLNNQQEQYMQEFQISPLHSENENGIIVEAYPTENETVHDDEIDRLFEFQQADDLNIYQDIDLESLLHLEQNDFGDRSQYLRYIEGANNLPRINGLILFPNIVTNFAYRQQQFMLHEISEERYIPSDDLVESMSNVNQSTLSNNQQEQYNQETPTNNEPSVEEIPRHTSENRNIVIETVDSTTYVLSLNNID